MFRTAAIRLTVFNALVIIAILAVAGVSTYGVASYYLEAGARDSLRQAASALQGSQALREAFSDGARLKGLDFEDTDGLGSRAVLPTLLFDARGRLIRTVNITFGVGDEEYESEHGGSTLAALTSAFADARERALAGEADTRGVQVGEAWFQVSSLPAVREGRTVGVAQVFLDVSDHARLLAALRIGLAGVGIAGIVVAAVAGYVLSLRAMGPLRRAFERQRSFIAQASHQLRTPVAVMRADADALSRSLKGLGAEDAQLLRDMMHEADFLTTVIQHLTAQARLDAPNGMVDWKTIEMSDLVRDTAQAVDSLARSRGMSLEIDVPVASFQVRGDAPALRLALMALLDNAIKYNRPQGTARVSLHRDGAWAVISVSDQGAGIPPEEIERVFDAFYRGSNAKASRVEGAGLGLSIVRQVARAHGGKVLVENAEPSGARVSLRLPLSGS